MSQLANTQRESLNSAPVRRSDRGNAKLIVIAIVAIAAIAAAVYFLMGGGGGAGSKVAGTFVPKDVAGYGAVDLAGLRKSPIYEAFKPQIDAAMAQPEVKASMDKAGITTDSFDTVAFGIGDFSGGAPKVVAAVMGSFDVAKLVEVAKEEMGDRVEEKDLGGTKFIMRKGQDTGLASGGDGALLLGTEDLVGRALTTKAGTTESVAKNEGLSGIAGKVDTGATFFMAMVVPDEAKGAAGMLPGDFSQIAGATHVAFSLDVSGDLVMKTAIKLASAADAEAVASQIKGLSGMAKLATGEVPADLKADVDAMIDSIATEASGDTAIVSARLSQDAVKKIAAMAKDGGLMGLL